MRRASLVLMAVAGLFLPAIARAQSAQTLAEVAFDEGRKLMAEKRFAEACPKLAESRRLDPGIGVSLYLGECHAQAGQYASAWGAFREAAGLARTTGDPREKIASGRAGEIEKRLFKIKVVVSPGSRPSGLIVERDGVPIAEALWGMEVPIDPGEHTIAATATGKERWTKRVVVPAEAGNLEIEIPALEAVPGPPASQPPTAAPSPAPTADPAAGSTGSSQRILGLGVAAGGAVGLGVGAIFGLKAMSKQDDIEAHCDGARCDSQDAVDQRDSARSAATVSTVGFVAGGALLVGGIVLYLATPSASAARSTARGTTRIVPGLASVALDVRF